MIAMVTGATSGFGAAIARRYIKEGWRVIATGRRTEKLDALREELGEPPDHLSERIQGA